MHNNVTYRGDNMPPIPQLTRQQILDKAFDMTRDIGFDVLTARGLAQALGCSTQPIFRLFNSMDGLKHALYDKTREFFETHMAQPMEGTPLFLSMGLRYVELARNEPHLFRLLCMSDCFHLESLFDITRGVKLQDPKLFAKVWIFTHGIASIVATNSTVIPEDEIRTLLIEAYTAFLRMVDSHVKHGS
jgi:AcrR family transcriptional regulator